MLPRIRCFGVGLLVVSAALPAVAESTSPSYRLKQATINGGGGVSVSPSGTAYRLAASIGQESSIGTSSSFGAVVQSGFWSFAGTGLVPILLTGREPAADPELSWSGNNPPYALYRSTNCAAVTSSFLTTTSSQLYTDTSSPAGSIVCYSVFATAPGPIAPVGAVSPEPDGTLVERP